MTVYKSTAHDFSVCVCGATRTASMHLTLDSTHFWNFIEAIDTVIPNYIPSNNVLMSF